jgi:cation transport ATPase
MESMGRENQKRENLKKESSDIRSVKNMDFNYNAESNKVELIPQKNNTAKLKNNNRQKDKSEKSKPKESEKLKQTENENKKLKDVKEIKNDVKGSREDNKKKADEFNVWLLLFEVIFIAFAWLKEKFPEQFAMVVNFLGWTFDIIKKIAGSLKDTWNWFISVPAVRKLFGLTGESPREKKEREA